MQHIQTGGKGIGAVTEPASACLKPATWYMPVSNLQPGMQTHWPRLGLSTKQSAYYMSASAPYADG